MTDAVEMLWNQRNELLVALRHAHDEEGVCSCPDGCVLAKPWARKMLAMLGEAGE